MSLHFIGAHKLDRKENVYNFFYLLYEHMLNGLFINNTFSILLYFSMQNFLNLVKEHLRKKCWESTLICRLDRTRSVYFL